VKLRYQSPEGGPSRLITAPVRDLDRADRGVSDDLGFAEAVAEFGMLLRNSDYKGTSSAEQVLQLARAHRGQDEDGYRAQFTQLVRTWATLARNRGEDVGVVE
jgi:Ca-activated chloride channel family protein